MYKGLTDRLAIGAIVTAGALATQTSLAQGTEVFVTHGISSVAPSGMGRGVGGSSAVSAKSIKAYAKLLHLEEDQTAMLESLHDGYRATHKERTSKHAEKIREIMSEFQESHDMDILSEDMPNLRREQVMETDAIEASFFEDVKLLLTDDQLEQFGGVERHRRRETSLRRGFLSGESVDLIELVDRIELTPASIEAIADELGSYEMDIDRALVAKTAFAKGSADSNSSFMVLAMGDEDTQDRMEKTRELSVRVRDVNENFARRIRGLLTEEESASFAREFDLAAFPGVYQQTHASKTLDAAAGFADLTTDQAEQLAQIRAGYEREVGAINTRWARAKREQEEDGNQGGFMTSGGASIMIMRSMDDGEGESDDPVAIERKAKKELDARTQDKIKGVLSDDQESRLPEAPKQHEGDFQHFSGSGGEDLSFEAQTITIIDDGEDR